MATDRSRSGVRSTCRGAVHAGGDGGSGGDVVLYADPDLRDLTALRFNPHVRAKEGRPGEGSNRSGSHGAALEVPVPVGTQVFTDDGTLVCDLAHPGARVVIARGGRGGAGNARFATATRQAPRLAGIGEDGEARTLELHLKLMADAALLGFPNVGKSSLLRRLSNATPKVADYPFTTIDPVLGTVDAVDGRQLTVVDVPGLLEGASEGVGLGHEFLAHLERARLLLHVVSAELDLDAARDGFSVIFGELEAHGHGLAERARIVVVNKIDLLPPEERAGVRGGVRRRGRGQRAGGRRAASCATRTADRSCSASRARPARASRSWSRRCTGTRRSARRSACPATASPTTSCTARASAAAAASGCCARRAGSASRASTSWRPASIRTTCRMPRRSRRCSRSAACCARCAGPAIRDGDEMRVGDVALTVVADRGLRS